MVHKRKTKHFFEIDLLLVAVILSQLCLESICLFCFIVLISLISYFNIEKSRHIENHAYLCYMYRGADDYEDYELG